MPIPSGFDGRKDVRVDAKGRLSVPAAFRKILAPDEHDEIVVLYDPAGNLWLFSAGYWTSTIQQEIMDKSVSMGKKQLRRVIHRISENSHRSAVDAQGRIIIPARLLEKAGIDKDVVVVGAFDRVSVWAPDAYEKWMAEEDVDGLIDEMDLF